MPAIPFGTETIEEPTLIGLTGATDEDQPESAASLRSRGLIRVHGLIEIRLNERLKALARKQNRNADQLIGELITRSASEVDRLEALQEAARLKERFGDHWLDLLMQIQY